MNASEFQILCPVTAEVAGSSPVVPAIHSKRLIGIGGIQKGCRRDTNMCPFCTPFSIAIRSRLRLRWANFGLFRFCVGLRLWRKHKRHDGSLGRVLGWSDRLGVDVQRGSQRGMTQ